MRRALTLAGLAVAAVLALLWLSGGFAGLMDWVEAGQRAAQDRLAAAVRALRGGEPGAMAALWTVCLAYGALHAAGPGHGKALIGGYGIARRVPVGRLVGLAVASSLAQAAVAVVLVHAALGLLGLTREAVEEAGSGWITAVGNLMIAGLGLWLVWRGLSALRRQGAGQGHGHGHGHHHDHDHGHHHDHHHDHGHDHDHGPDCGCGHAHGPTLAQAEQVTGFRDAALLVAGIAMRPCTGALFLLILTWKLGIPFAGIVGAFAMGLGVAAVTVAVALMAVWAREGALAALPGAGLARVLPLVEAVAGAVIVALAIGLLWQGL